MPEIVVKKSCIKALRNDDDLYLMRPYFEVFSIAYAAHLEALKTLAYE